MPNADNPEPTVPAGTSNSSPSDQEFPLLHPEDEDDLREGETEMTFGAPPPDGDE